MTRTDRDDALRPRPRFSTLLPAEHLRRTTAQAGRELISEENDSVESIARILDRINEVESRTDLQARIAVLEEQVERLRSRRDEVDQEFRSELSVLRTTLESALEAISTPAVSPEALRREFEEKLLEARSDLRFEIVKVQKELEDLVPAGVDTTELEEIREDFQARIAASEERSAKVAGELEDLVAAQRAQLDSQRALHAELVRRLSNALAGFAQSLNDPAAVFEEPEPSL